MYIYQIYYLTTYGLFNFFLSFILYFGIFSLVIFSIRSISKIK